MPSKVTVEKTGLTPESEQAIKKRVRWLLPMVKFHSAEPDGLETKSDSVEFQHFMLSGIYWHTLNGVKYRKAYEELNSRQFADWFKTVQI